MEPLLNCTEVVIDFSKEEIVTREVLLMFKRLQQAIRLLINNLDETQVGTASETIRGDSQ